MTITVSDNIAQIVVTALAWIIGIKMVISLLTQLVSKAGKPTKSKAAT
jgi:hypothetical protein